MTAILKAEARAHIRSAGVLVVVFGVIAALYFSIFPEFAEEEAAEEDILEIFPEGLVDFLGIEAIHTIEGFIAAELYTFFWVVFAGVYFAYLGAGTIAGDVENRRLDLLLANPVSRESVLVQKVAALLVPLFVLNAGVFVIVLAASRVIDEPIGVVPLAMVHILGSPYLLVCAGIGVLVSVYILSIRSAQGVALGAVFVLWLLEGATNIDPEYEWIGQFMPSRYFEETAILVREEYALFDAGILMLAFLVLVLLATGRFIDRDL